jgi:Arc/MetJ-type ribon-helix-helix transcriptional regulator
MRSRISGRIARKDKEKIRLLVEKKMFPSMSEFYRMAISRFLRELEAYEKKRVLEKKEALGRASEEERREVEKEMRDLIKFIEDLY